MGHLSPHPWDAFGEPPKPGLTYGIADDGSPEWECANGHAACESADDCIDELEADADVEYEDQARLQDDARDAERRGDDLYRKADDIREARGEKRKWPV